MTDDETEGKELDDRSPSPGSSDDMEDDNENDHVNNNNNTSVEDNKPVAEVKKLTPEEEQAKKQRDAELREKYKDWPLRNIKEPHDNDVMYGRGGGTNHHPGNKQYRKMVEDRKLEYVNCKRLDKPLVALEIIREWRGQLPPGRFLKLDEKTGLWNDVGDKKAREKTSQALREKAPMIRRQQDDEDEDDDENTEDLNEGSKTTGTRFAKGTKEQDANSVRKAVLARDHSLGREYIEAGQAVSLDGFSWQDPFQPKQRDTSYGRPAAQGASYPAGRNSSHGSLGMAPPPHHQVSIGGPPPPPDYWGGHVSSSGSRQHEFANGRVESWGSTSYGYFMAPPPPPPPPGSTMHQRSGSWTHGPPRHPGPVAHRRSGSWGSGRENSLGMFPLIGASIAGPVDHAIFDSGQSWGEGVGRGPHRGMHGPAPPPPPQPHPYDYGAPVHSSGSRGLYRQPTSPANSTPSPKPYDVDISIARTWSGGASHGLPYGDMPPPAGSANRSPVRERGVETVPKPQIVKRDTSNQNESYETKPSIKRAALNRDNSLASNRLKQEFMPEYFNRNFDAEKEVRSLSTNLELSSIDVARPKPKPLGAGERMSTMDIITMDLMAKPVPIMKDDRLTTIDALELGLQDDSIIEGDQPTVSLVNLPKPKSLEPIDRLTTKDFADLLNSPLAGVDEDVEQENRHISVSFSSLNRENQLSDDWLIEE